MAARKPRRCRVQACHEIAYERSRYCWGHVWALDEPGDVVRCALAIHDATPSGGDCPGHEGQASAIHAGDAA